MKPFVTLIYNCEAYGGILNYNNEIVSKTKKIMQVNEINFKEIRGDNIVEKIASVLVNRKKYLIKQKNKISKINHFLSPDIFYHVKELDEKTNICTIHDLFLLEPTLVKIGNLYDFLGKILFLRRFKEVVKHVDFFISDSELTTHDLIKQGIEKRKIKTINLGLDKEFKVIKNFEERQNIIGYLGDNNKRKRINKLIRDWKYSDIKNFKLILAGHGIKQVNFDNKFKIDYLGELPKREIPSYYNSLKAFILPSVLEGFGLNIIEATACGTPVFIYKDAKISDEVKKYTFKIGSISEIPETLNKINQNDLNKISKKVKNEFSWDKTVKETIKIYERFR